MAITLTQLTAFLAVVRGGSVTAAADELVVTQPSVSSALTALSRELGCNLFERAGRGVRLTEAGSAFAPYATDVIGLLNRGRQSAREAAALSARKLQIAAVTTAAESFVPPLMRAFSDEHPDVELTLAVGNRQDVLERVRAHTVDVAISGKPPTEEGLLAEPLSGNEIVCITAPDDPAAAGPDSVTGTGTGTSTSTGTSTTARGPLEAGDLSGRTWLLRETGSGTRALNERFLADHGLEPNTLTLGSNGAVKQAARAGLGVSLLSRVAAEAELESGRLGEIRLSGGPPPRPWFVIRSAVGPARPSVDTFVAFLRAASAG
jgi:LysR family transcriptional regulator, low CO2-responsive transcriptional regulator